MADDARNQHQHGDEADRATSPGFESHGFEAAEAITTQVYELTDGQVVFNLTINVAGGRVPENVGRRVVINVNVNLDRTGDKHQDSTAESSGAAVAEASGAAVEEAPVAQLLELEVAPSEEVSGGLIDAA